MECSKSSLSDVSTTGLSESGNRKIQLLIRDLLHLKWNALPMVLVDLIIEYQSYIGIYIINGTTNQRTNQPTYGQLVSSTFKQITTLPLPDGFHQLVGFSVARSTKFNDDNNRLYVTGGGDSYWNYSDKYTDSFAIYNIHSATWTKGPSLLTLRNGHTSQIVDSKLYVIGGVCSVKNISSDPTLVTITYDMEIFDMKMNHWTTGVDMKFYRTNQCSCVIENKIYVFGGETIVQTLNLVEMFDTKTQTWHDLEPMPTGRHNAHAVVVPCFPRSDGTIIMQKSYNKILILGGTENISNINTIDEYDVSTNKWRTLELKLPVEFYPYSAWLDEPTCTLHLAFGMKLSNDRCVGHSSSHFVCDLSSLETSNMTWTYLPDFPITMKRFGYCL
jgi:hypothetical protein